MLESNSSIGPLTHRPMSAGSRQSATRTDASIEESERLIHALHAQVDEWRGVEIARARKMLARGKDIEAVLEVFARGLSQKVLHGTMIELNSRDVERREQLSNAVSRFFLRGSDESGCDERLSISECLGQTSNLVADAATEMVEQ